MHTHDLWQWMLPSLKVRVPAHPQHAPCESRQCTAKVKKSGLNIFVQYENGFDHYIYIKN